MPLYNGNIPDATLNWIRQRLINRDLGIIVLPMMHQSVLEDWVYEKQVSPAYVDQRNKEIRDLMVELGGRTHQSCQ